LERTNLKCDEHVRDLYYDSPTMADSLCRGPISKIASMIPGLPQDLLQGSDEEGSLRMKRMIYITDSMTAAELDSDGTPFMEHGEDGKPISLTWRVTRVARGSGTSVREVEELLCQYQMMSNMAKQAGGKNGWCVFACFKKKCEVDWVL
jgi:signal recognition particle subunit SRP54